MTPVAYWWICRPPESRVAMRSGTVATNRMRFGGQQLQGYQAIRSVVAAPSRTMTLPVRRCNGLEYVEPAAVERQSRQHGIAPRPLDRVREPRLACCEEQAPGQHRAPDGRTGFRVRPIRRQLEGLAERLVAMTRPEGAGEVGERRVHRLPALDGGGKQLAITGLGRNINDPAVEVHLADRVAGGIARKSHCLMVLPVPGPVPPGAEEAPAAPLDESARECEVLLRPGEAIQLHQCHLDLRVSVDPFAPTRPELCLDAADRPLGDLQETSIAEASTPGDGCLGEVARGVELMPPLEVRELAAGLRDLEVRVQVAVGPLPRATSSMTGSASANRSSTGPLASSQPTASSHL